MPIPFVPIILGGAAAVGLTAAVVSFIFGEMTEAEKRKQEKMENDLLSFQRREKHELSVLLKQYQLTEEEFLKSTSEEIIQLRKSYQNKNWQAKRELSLLYVQMAKEQIELSKFMKKEIQQAEQRLRVLIKSQKTILRSEAMNYLLRELQIGIKKVDAYISYLYKYINTMTYKFDKYEIEDFLYSMRLPDDFPYIGKLQFFKKEELQNGKVSVLITHKIYVNFKVDDPLELDEFPEDANIPVLITNFDGRSTNCNVSVGKGIFKHIAIDQSKIGVNAMVKKYNERRQIELDYKGVVLTLPIRSLENPLKLPPIGAIVRVYPTRWDGILQSFIYVSEKYQDSLKSFQFTSLPITFSNQGANEFFSYLQENPQNHNSSEWKIGPYEEEELVFKLQLSNSLIFTVRMIQSEHTYFVYDKLLPLDQNFKPEDIFIVMDAEFEMVLEEELHLLTDESYENMANLSLMLLQEITTQEQLSKSIDGMNYFAKWTELTEQLIDYLSKGEPILCELGRGTTVPYQTKMIHMYKHTYEIINQEEVYSSLQRLEEEYLPQFFIEQERIKVEFDETSRTLICYSLNRDLQLSDQTVIVYVKKFSYPETQQRQSLDDFRSGILINSHLQPYILNGENITSNRQELPLLIYNNKNVEINLAQKIAVENALSEKNIYLIQGPPGTGKTTVIREMMHQQLQLQPTSRILIVSQANVAIDNVLKGFQERYYIDMIRCGNIDKIDEALNSISFDEKYSHYQNIIAKKDIEEPLEVFMKQWKSIVSNEIKGNAPIMGELIVRNHKIVGATCLGLMQRKIGLNRVMFDLVIIDEAGKALPAELLIPINRAKKVIMIGDHMQLPPVIHPALYDSEKIEIADAKYCKEELFTTSLFERLYKKTSVDNKSMLDTQYRMPAVIGSMISKFFYDGKLKNGDSTYQRETKYFNKHLNLLDLSNNRQYQETTKNGSVTNLFEAEIVVDIIKKIRKERPIDEKIAVICPYKGQNRCIKSAFNRANISMSKLNISVNTIDAYQGDEAEIVIYCMTRAKKRTLYFSDEARLNVALSRVKNDLLIIGSLKYLKSYGKTHIVNKLASYIEQNGDIFDLTELNSLKNIHVIEDKNPLNVE